MPIRLLQPKKRVTLHGIELNEELSLFQVISRLVFNATNPDSINDASTAYSSRNLLSFIFFPLSSAIVSCVEVVAPVESVTPSPSFKRLTATTPLGQTVEYEIVIQGIHPPLATPIRWLARALSSPDNFLYIAVKKLE